MQDHLLFSLNLEKTSLLIYAIIKTRIMIKVQIKIGAIFTIVLTYSIFNNSSVELDFSNSNFLSKDLYKFNFSKGIYV